MNARVRQAIGAATAVAGAAVFSAVSLIGQAPARPGAAAQAPARPAASAAAAKEDLSVLGYVPGYKAPRTPWGDPDLQGIWNGNDLQGVPTQRATTVGNRMLLNDEEYRQRVASRDRLVETDNLDFDLEISEQFAAMGTVGGPVSPPPHWLERANTVSRLASFLIDPPDGRMPPTTPAAQAAAAERQKAQAARRSSLQGREADSYTDRSNYDRCISNGVLNSVTPKIYNSGNRIVQGPGWLAWSQEMIHETRVIPTDGRPTVSPAIKSWMGTSVGRWEGDTLVVTTTGLKPESALSGNPLSDEGKIIERFTRVGPKTLEYKMTVDDPKTWTRPWTIMLPLPLDEEYIFAEYACHEGNYTMFNILSGSRRDEQLQAEAAAKGLPDPLAAGRSGGAGGGGGRGGRGGGAPGGAPGGAGRGAQP
jgi:hypothetical protein